jgi:tRNA(Ile)-lysidine synthase TilS/MesJ
MQCSKCGVEAVIFQQYSGRYLCPKHLASDIESRIKRNIRNGCWMRPGDHLAVALSGSKRARALLLFFSQLTAQRRDIRLSAIVIDDGGTRYRDLPRIREAADALGIPCHTGSLAGEDPQTPGEPANDSATCPPSDNFRQHRHDLIGKIAQREGITRIISDRTIEDRATEILEKILRGQVEKLFEAGSMNDPVPWIDPLGSVPRAEADLYADLVCPGSDEPACPDGGDDFSDEIKGLLEDYTRHHPATLYSVLGIGRTVNGCGRSDRNEMEDQSHAA